MDALEDLSYDLTTSPVKQDDDAWAANSDDDDDGDDDGLLGLSAAESEPRDEEYDPDDVEPSGSASDGSTSDDDATAPDGEREHGHDADDSVSTHSGAETASAVGMSRRASKAGESGKDDDDDDEDEDDDDDDGDDEEDGDEEMKEVDEQMGGLARSASPSHTSAAGPSTSMQPRRSPSLPPALKRRRLFFPPSPPPAASSSPLPRSTGSLHIDPHMTIPISSPVHSLAATPCLSYVLTGSEDGVIRAWDTWASANGASALTAHQRAVGGLGEGVTKGGVSRGWWDNEGPQPPPSAPATLGSPTREGEGEGQRVREPVYSLAIQRDALWGLSGTASGSLNLFTIRHALGRTQHRLVGGHTSAVSALVLADSEDLAYSAGWDGVVCEWDLHTGQKLRAFPSQNVQLSSLALQPSPSGPVPPARTNIAVAYSAWARDPAQRAQTEDSSPEEGSGADAAPGQATDADVDGDVQMASPSAAAAPATTTTTTTGPPSDADAEGEPDDDDDDLFGDGGAELEALAAKLELPADMLNSIPATVSPPPLLSAVPIETTPTKLALPNGSAAKSVNGSTSSQVKTEPNGVATPMPPAPPPPPPAPVARSLPSLSPATHSAFSPDVLLTSAIDGSVVLWDRRVSNKEVGKGRGVGRLEGPERTPKWCMSACFNSTGTQVWAGRRNGAVDIWDIRRPSSVPSASGFDSGANLLRTLKNPSDSGPVSSLVAFPDGRHMACAQTDNIRLWSTDTLFDDPLPATTSKSKSSGVPFKIVPGHHGGIVSSMLVDPLGKFLITASGNRGWAGFGESTSVVLFHTVEQVRGRR